MSGSNFFKSSIVVGASVVALTLGACASSGASGSRYGNVYDYESGSGSCNSSASCGAVVTPPVDSRYGSATTGTVIGGQPVSPGVVYMDCSQTGMGCGAPAPIAPTVYSPPSMQQAPSAVYTSPPSMSYSGEAVSCPANTTPAGDGTCMMSGSGSVYTGSTSTSSGSGWSSSTTSSGGTVDCPSGTTRTSDGTCLMGSGTTTPSVTIYPTTPTTGYVPPVDYTAPVYQPIRK